jgi:hypothetical protein
METWLLLLLETWHKGMQDSVVQDSSSKDTRLPHNHPQSAMLACVSILIKSLFISPPIFTRWILTEIVSCAVIWVSIHAIKLRPCSLELISTTFQPCNNIFLSQQIRISISTTLFFSQPNRVLVVTLTCYTNVVVSISVKLVSMIFYSMYLL